MIDWIAVIVLIIFGLGFIVAEIIFVPGTTLLGLLGLVFTITGVVLGYLSFGGGIGTVIVITAIYLLGADPSQVRDDAQLGTIDGTSTYEDLYLNSIRFPLEITNILYITKMISLR